MRTWWRATTVRGRTTLVVGLALVATGIAARYPVVAGFGVALVVLALAELIAVLGSSGLQVSRTVTPVVVVRHGQCEGTLRIIGRRRRGLLRLDTADLVDGALVPVRLPDETASRAASRPDGVSGVTSIAYPVPTQRRGLIDVGPVQLRRYGLTGMAARSTTTGAVDQVRVLPRRIPMHSLPRGRRRAVQGGPDSLEHGGTDLVGLHEYGMGDDLRRVHWASSARTGTLMVREDAEPSEPQLLVLLDDRAASYPTSAEGTALFEEAVEVAAGLSALAGREGQPVRLRTTSGRHAVDVEGSTGRTSTAESQELDYVFADIQLTDQPGPVEAAGRDLDIVVAVTGPGADEGELLWVLGAAHTRVVITVDPSPSVAISHRGGAVTLRGSTSVELAALWDQAVQG